MPARAGFIRTGGYQKMQAAQPDIVDTAVAAGSFDYTRESGAGRRSG